MRTATRRASEIVSETYSGVCLWYIRTPDASIELSDDIARKLAKMALSAISGDVWARVVIVTHADEGGVGIVVGDGKDFPIVERMRINAGMTEDQAFYKIRADLRTLPIYLG